LRVAEIRFVKKGSWMVWIMEINIIRNVRTIVVRIFDEELLCALQVRFLRTKNSRRFKLHFSIKH